MKAEEQICAYKELRNNGQAFFIDNYEDADRIIEALKKQIPKKPKFVEVERESMDMETGEEYTYKIDEAHCRCCDFIIGADYDIFDECYCEKCGQKIDWSCWK